MTATLTRPAAPDETPRGAPESQPSASPTPPLTSKQQRFAPVGKVTTIGVVAWLSLVALSVATIVSLCRIFPGWGYLTDMVVIAVAVHVVCLAVRALGRGTVAMTIAGLAAIATLVARQSFGMWPSRGAWDALWAQMAEVWTQFPTAVAPVPGVGGFATGIGIAVGLIALLAEIFAFRAFGRAEAVVPSFLLFVAASSLGYDRNRLAVALVWLACAAITVALLRNAHQEGARPWLSGAPRRSSRQRASNGWQRARTVGVGLLPLLAIGLPLAVAASSHLPGSHDEALIDTRNRRGDNVFVINPLVDIQARLNQRSNVELFTVKADRPRYWRLTASSRFDGREWLPSDTYRPVEESTQLIDDFNGSLLRQDIRITLLGNAWVPTAFQPVAIDQMSSPMMHSAITGSIMRDGDNLSEGLRLTVVSAIPDFTAAQLQAAPFSAGPDPEFLALPDDYPQEFTDLARQITAGANTPYQQALVLQNWFLDNFDYDKNYQADNSLDGISSFLAARRGFCQQFAGTFAAFARSIGLPSRVAAGTTWGDRDENGVYHVLGKHAHAWPEIYLEGLGWVEFEPTPGRGQPGSETVTGRESSQDGGSFDGSTDRPNGQDRPVAPPPTLANGQGSVAPPRSIPRDEFDSGPSNGAVVPRLVQQSNGIPVKPFVVLGFLGAAAGWLFGMPLVVRRRLDARTGSPAQIVMRQWTAAGKALALAGVAPTNGETPNEYADRSRAALGKVKADFVTLADSVTRATYSSSGLSEHDANDAVITRRAVQRTLRFAHGWKTKLWGRISPNTAKALG